MKDTTSKKGKCPINKIMGLLVVGFFILSCKDLVEVAPPKTEIVSSSVFSSDEKAISAITVIYSQLVQRDEINYKIPWMAGLSSDELINHSMNSEFMQLYENALNPNNSIIKSFLWTPLYNYIYEANAVIEALEKSGSVSLNIKQQLIGEAKFIRAFCHFYLLNFFSDIPIITDTDYAKNIMVNRSSAGLVYEQIVADLLEAKGQLQYEYVDRSSGSSSSERLRPNKAVATALLARVYLYMEDYGNAEEQATILINDNRFLLADDIGDVFLKESPEAIWSLSSSSNVFHITNEAFGFVLSNAPSSFSYMNSTELGYWFLEQFNSSDLRNSSWIGAFSDFQFPYKYKNIDIQLSSEYSIVFRLSEQYLIRAEARANLDKLIGENSAESDLNTIRLRAGLLPSAALSKEEILKDIFQERNFEFFAEWGHRWFDLKRSGHLDEVMHNITPIKGGIWESYKALYPIPQTERNIAPNLTQNDGYQ